MAWDRSSIAYERVNNTILGTCKFYFTCSSRNNFECFIQNVEQIII